MTTTTDATVPDAPAEEPQPTPAAVTLRAVVLRQVLDGLLAFAGNDPEMPILAAVRLRTRTDGQLTMIATDRYRAGLVRLAGSDAWDATSTIDAVLPRDAVEALVAWLPHRRDDYGDDLRAHATITQTGNRVEVKLAKENSFGFRNPAFSFDVIDTPNYPDVESVIRPHVNRQPNLTEPVGIDSRLINGLDKFRWGLDDTVRIWGGDPHGGIAIAVGDHFIGAVMPVRHHDDYCYREGRHVPWSTYNAALWGPILGEPDEQKAEDQ